MKSYKLVKWIIVGVLFVLTTISGLCLYHKEKDKFNESGNKEFTLQNQIKILEESQDSIKISVKELNDTVEINSRKITEELKVICNNGANSVAVIDSLNTIFEKKVIETQKNVLDEIAKQKLALQEIVKFEKQLPVAKKQNNFSKYKYKPAFGTIIHFVITVMLLVSFLSLLILFSGVLKFFTRKKNNKNQVNNNIQQLDSIIQNNFAETNTDRIKQSGAIEKVFNFELPYLDLSFEIIKGQNIGECTVIIKCTHEDAEIKYCIVPDTTNLLNYTSPIKVNRKCTLLVMAAYGDIRSKQLNIVVDPDSEVEESFPKSITDKSEVGKDNNVNLETKTNVSDNSKGNLEVTNTKDDRIRIFTSQSNVLGISYQGDSHIKANPVIPCQDCHSFTKVNDVWSIAIVSDGAGSKKHSDIGSKAVCLAFASYLSFMLQINENFANGNIPNERIWDLEFRAILTRFQDDIKNHKNFASFDFESLAATIVIFAYSPKGYLFAHVGDGRAGVKVNGEWKSILTPHKGDEVNQTIFSTTVEFINKPTLLMSGVFVPETKVEKCNVEAFVLMSDGCENGAWATYQKINLPDGDFRVEDVNQPRSQILEELMAVLDVKDGQKAKLVEFITGYNKGFKTESDDKTILIGRIK